MTLEHILVLSIFSLLAGWLFPNRWRPFVLLIASLLAVYWLQPSTSIRSLDFWLPTASIGLTLITWAVTQPDDPKVRRNNLGITFAILILILAIGLSRYIPPVCCLTPSRPPQFSSVLIGVCLIAAITILFYRFIPLNRRAAGLVIIIILAIFIILKFEPLTYTASAKLRDVNGQDPALASILDFSWLGFSYLAFRLIHVLRDFQNNRLPPFTSSEVATYALFYPALTAGPIDRSQRFIQSDLQKSGIIANPERLLGIQRIIIGIFKKFVVADTLALIALNQQHINQVDSSLWAWVLLYAFTLQIYFDFSGYTDIALGLGLLVGIHLPENFDGPYLKTNLTAFWNSWHITLAQWFRAYVFNPLTRSLRSSHKQLPAWLIILIGQMVTMLLIGLWHGITWTFAIWGLWHGVGLFVQNRWSEWSRPRLAVFDNRRSIRGALVFISWLVTFNYVVLGWVWFAVPDINQAIGTFQKLFGR